MVVNCRVMSPLHPTPCLLLPLSLLLPTSHAGKAWFAAFSSRGLVRVFCLATCLLENNRRKSDSDSREFWRRLAPILLRRKNKWSSHVIQNSVNLNLNLTSDSMQQPRDKAPLAASTLFQAAMTLTPADLHLLPWTTKDVPCCSLLFNSFCKPIIRKSANVSLLCHCRLC